MAELSKWAKEGKLAILADSSFSKIRGQLAKELKDKKVIWSEFEAIDLRQPEISLSRALDQEPLRAIPKLDKASRVISLDCDFLGNREPNSLANARAFMAGRKVLKPTDAKKMNRLYSVESDLTITGGVADHRLRLDSSNFSAFAALLLAEVLKCLEILQNLW